jgi:hypothetical protein
MATRKRSRSGDQLSKLSDKLVGLAGKKCIASYIRNEHGDGFMILMADGCPACLEAKASSVSATAPAQPLLRPALARPQVPDPA